MRRYLSSLMLAAVCAWMLVLAGGAQAQVRGGTGGVVAGGPALPAAREATRGGLSAFSQATGFSCLPGQRWGIQDGMVKCMVPVVSSIPGFAGKTVFVRFPLLNGFVSGRLLRFTGTENDVRVDIVDLRGALGTSCYLTVAEKACDLGSPGGYQPGLASDPRYRYIKGGQVHRGTAEEILSGPFAFADDRRGGSLQDNYVVSARISDGGISVSLVGLFSMSNSSGEMSVVYARGTFSATQLAAAINNDTWTASTSWPGPYN